MIKKGVFISFCWDDRTLTKRIHDAVKKTRHLYPIVITNPERANAQQWNPDKVAHGIVECSYFIPIISEKAVSSQWVNQEIGYAAALERPIFPVVQQKLVDERKLKGWVNSERDQPYRFDIHEEPKKARRHFRNAYKPLLEHLDKKASELVYSELSDRDRLELEKGKLAFYHEGKEKGAFLILGDFAYPVASMQVFNALKVLLKKETQVEKSEIDKLKQGQLIKL
jgi:hypothetical protein